MAKYYIRKDSDGDYSIIDEEQKEREDKDSFKFCCICCIGLIIASIISYIIILICGHDPTGRDGVSGIGIQFGGVLSWLAIPFGVVWQTVVTSVPFLNWIPVLDIHWR